MHFLIEYSSLNSYFNLKIRGNLISTKEQLTKHEANIQEKEKLKDIPKDILNKSKNLFENVMLWDRLIDETNNLKEKILNIEDLMVKTGMMKLVNDDDIIILILYLI